MCYNKVMTINYSQTNYRNHNISAAKLLEKIDFVIKWIYSYYDTSSPKIKDALYAYNWLIRELTPFCMKLKYPTKKQRKAAIEILETICDNTVTDEPVHTNIKIAAEFVKRELDKQFAD